MESVECLLDADVDHTRNIVTCRDRQTAVHVYPVSVEWPNRWVRQSPPVDTCRADVRRQLGLPPDIQMVAGVDRLDYTKGILEKCLAIERLLERRPGLCGRVVFVQIAEPSRGRLPEYQAYRARVQQTIARINRRFGTGDWQPVILLDARHEPADVFRVLRAADVCYVGSIRDGMNLVAKEFVVARDDERGVLVLSRGTGSACELTGALIVDPFDIEGCAGVLARALAMTPGEQATRMRAMRRVVAEFNVHRWIGDMLTDAARLRVDRSFPVSDWPAEALRVW
jgi:trehalose 6-phosphate synthase